MVVTYARRVFLPSGNFFSLLGTISVYLRIPAGIKGYPLDFSSEWGTSGGSWSTHELFNVDHLLTAVKTDEIDGEDEYNIDINV